MAFRSQTARLRAHFRSIGRQVYHLLPPGRRDAATDFCYRYAGPLFRGFRDYELWRGNFPDSIESAPQDNSACLVDLDPVRMLGMSPGRIAVHAHVYYHELADELATHLGHMPFPYDLFVSVTSETGRDACQQAFARLPRLGSLRMEIVPNRGRDIAPMLCTFGAALRGYDFIAHVHTKKSLYNQGATDGWREYLLGGLFGDERRLRKIFHLLRQGAALVYPQTFHRVPYAGCSWMANRQRGREWCERLAIQCIPNGYFDFPVGSMFWARMNALRPLFDAGINLDDFEPESGQNDGTFAHIAERLIGIIAQDSGRKLLILRDTSVPSWSPWRLEQYLRRSSQASQAYLLRPEVQLVVFDVFDTLLSYPLLDPEQLHAIVARNAGPELGAAYLDWRRRAEAAARQRAGREVGLAAIIDELRRLAGLDVHAGERLRQLEIAAGMAAVATRPDALDLFRKTVASGKRVVIAADTALCPASIASMLRQHGFDGWQALYLTSEMGLRKDSEAFYAHILQTEDVAATDALMVGDSEHADLQIPGNAGWQYLHLMRPSDLARALIPLAPLIRRVDCGADLDAQLGLGLVVRGITGRLHYDSGFDAASRMPQPSPYHIGYAICGPLVFAFTQWLLERARADRIDTLYFLAREGEFLKIVYDRVVAGRNDTPAAEYLVVSRRALNVPAIETLDDALAIARAHYGPASLDDFLWERFGLSLDEPARQDLAARGLWEQGQLLEISAAHRGTADGILEALLPLILAERDLERPATLAYLRQMRVGEDRAAVVDVGFSGTIQRRLNTLLGGGIAGYYMATLANVDALRNDFGVKACGAYHDAARLDAVPPFIHHSFLLEKLLSADTTQLMRYIPGADGRPQAEFRPLTDAERAVFPLRAEIRAGTLRFVDEAIAAQRELLGDFRFPLDLAAQLFEGFVCDMSEREAAVMRGVILDDHYCGRGLVN